jgi:phosphoribosyl-ATP pyrophosphohydrolase
VEEAAEVWMAAEYQGKEALALEISQLIYHIQLLMHTYELSMDDVYKNL